MAPLTMSCQQHHLLYIIQIIYKLSSLLALQCYAQVHWACLTFSFLVREHMQSQTGAMKTVNKEPRHHLGLQDEHSFTKSNEQRGNFTQTSATHKRSGSGYSYQMGYIAIGVTPPCPAILDRQPAINVTCNVCQLTLKQKRSEYNLKSI